MSITLIAAVGEDGCIAEWDKESWYYFIPWDYPGDRKFFREQTAGSAVIMGRRTWAQDGPFGGRINIVLSKKMDTCRSGAYIFRSLPAALSKIQGPIYLIGGRNVYFEGLDYCDELLITRVPYTCVDTAIKCDFLLDKQLETNFRKTSCVSHPYDSDLTLDIYTRRPLEEL